MPLDTVNNGESGQVARGKINACITQVNTNVSSISANTASIATNTTNIATNTSGLATLSSTVSSLSTTVSGLVTAVNTHTGQISALQASVTTNTTNIATNTTNIATNTADILLKQNKNAVSTLIETVRTASGNFTILNSSDSQFVWFTGSASGVDIPDDATIPLVARGKRFSFWNDTGSSGSITITPSGAAGVVYAGALTNVVAVGEYCELMHHNTNRWLRVK